MSNIKSTLLVEKDQIPDFDWKIIDILKELQGISAKDFYNELSVAFLDDRNMIYRIVQTKGPEEFIELTSAVEEIGFKRVRKNRRTKDMDSVYRFAPDGSHETRD